MRQYRGWSDLRQCGGTAARNRQQQTDGVGHHSSVTVRPLKECAVPVDAIKTGVAPLTVTSALNGGEWAASRAGRLAPREPSLVSTEQQTGRAPRRPVWAPRKRLKSLILAGDRTTNSRLSRKNFYER
jgi:hypothetical protein